MGLSLSQLMAQWTVEFDQEQDLVIVLPATREVGLFLRRAYFRLMNLPTHQKVTIILVESSYTIFRENDLGYKEDAYKYVSRAYAMAEGLANDKIEVIVVDGEGFTESQQRKHEITNFIERNYRNANVLVYGLPEALYPIKYFKLISELFELKGNENSNIEGKVLGVYVGGTEEKGLKTNLIGELGDISGIVGLSYDDSLQTQLGVSTMMFTVLNKWISGLSLSSRTMSMDLGTGNIKLGIEG